MKWFERFFLGPEVVKAAERQNYIKQTAEFYASRPEVQRDKATMKLTDQELEDKLEALNELILVEMRKLDELDLQRTHIETNIGYYADRKTKLYNERNARASS